MFIIFKILFLLTEVGVNRNDIQGEMKEYSGVLIKYLKYKFSHQPQI